MRCVGASWQRMFKANREAKGGSLAGLGQAKAMVLRLGGSEGVPRPMVA